MSKSRLIPRSIRAAILALIVAVGGIAFREHLPTPVRDRLPSLAETKAGLQRAFTNATAGGVKSAAANSSEVYWPGLPMSRKESLITLTHIGYTVGYSTKVFSPLWAAYAIKSVSNPVSAKRPESFTPDPGIPAQFQVETSEYTRSNFDRGHMAPNWAVSVSYGREAQTESFYTSNITPQEPAFNRGIWEALERIEANDYAKRYNGVVSFDGPIFDPNSTECIGRNHRIRIPSGCYKIIVRRVSGQVSVLAFIIPQSARGDGNSLCQYLVAVDKIEALTGLDFLTAFSQDQQKALESVASSKMW